MWKQSWRYAKEWAICPVLFVTGIALQLIFGRVDPTLFRFPVNIICGALFLLCLFLIRFASKRVKWLQWFWGLSAALTSMGLLLLLVMCMGLIKQMPFMVVSWPFLLFSLYLLSVLGLVILERLSRFTWKDTGFVLNHAGFFIAFFAALLGSSDFQRLRVSAPLNFVVWQATNEKGELVELPAAVELKSFDIEEYPPKLMIVEHATGRALPVKRPAYVSIEECPAETKLLDWSLKITKKQEAPLSLYVMAQNLKNGAQREGWVCCEEFLLPGLSLRLDNQVSLVMPNREPKRFISDITIYTQQGERSEVLEVNRPLSLAGWKIYQASYDAERGKRSEYSTLEIVKDPWLPVVYIGIVMLLVGSIFLFVSAPKKET